MTPTAHDYAWTADSSWFPDLRDSGYSLTLVRGRTPDEVLELLGAVPQGFGDGVDDVFDCQQELYAWLEDPDEDSYTVGALAVPGDGGDWTLLLALDRGAGVDGGRLAALSRGGGEAVQHGGGGGDGPAGRFRHYRDGEPRAVAGAEPDADGVQPGGGAGPEPALLALAERLTGVRVTEELVRDGAFVLGVVPDRELG
ncbi:MULTISPECIES: DUF6461 domain-containing protein [Kitasatospora]|uniref:Uncharacterized protein n=1 Tax=Kitasatospora setae (strain ATCC 33774 / DSM 43861 / JCM 3304 / KCC A-0304 / NBRC 14216 / KM-6054) TaxID=452652 RepID=E4NDA8_KITSK|nr:MULTISPECIES: DUF6461 domain-containing protein [Kitasatospora]BAJ29189.1 hypothetical protein KSE_33810 [Kitasatospora setae KM-6054]